MCRIKDTQTEIERCQLQIATIFGLPAKEQETESNQIVLQGFQLQLKILFHEKSRLENSKRAKSGSGNKNQSRVRKIKLECRFKERALQTHHCTIQQARHT